MSDRKNDFPKLTREISATLDHELERLGDSTLSQLRQARYKAIDHGAIIDTPDHFLRWSTGFASALGVVMVLTVGNVVLQEGEDEYTADQINELDTREDLEIYEWLYNNYG